MMKKVNEREEGDYYSKYEHLHPCGFFGRITTAK